MTFCISVFFFYVTPPSSKPRGAATRGRKSAVVPDGQVRVLWDGERSISDLHPEALPLTVVCHDSQEMLRNFLAHSLTPHQGYWLFFCLCVLGFFYTTP